MTNPLDTDQAADARKLAPIKLLSPLQRELLALYRAQIREQRGNRLLRWLFRL